MNRYRLLVISLVLIFVSIFYVNLGRDYLFDWDEGIYATLGSEMLESRNYLVTTWNHEVWFEKPPGIAWLSGLGQTLGGHNAFGSRLFQPVVAGAVLTMLYLLGSRLISPVGGMFAMALLAGFNLFLGRSRAVNVDMPLLLGIISTSYFVLSKKSPLIVAIAIAWSVWFKGLAGLLSVIIALPLYLTVPRKFALYTLYFTLLFVLPWHLYVYAKYGDSFLNPYFREQVLARALTPIEFHTESRWFYLSYLYENLGLGAVICAAIGVFLALQQFVQTRQLKKLYLLWWLAVPIIIFTAAKTRLFWYILPVYPAIALLIAYAFDKLSVGKVGRYILIVLTFGICLRSLGIAWQSIEPAKKTVQPSARIELANRASSPYTGNLAVLVPLSERMAEAILPAAERISSSFRYGGMPSVVYYYRQPVHFFYNVDEFREYLAVRPDMLAMLNVADLTALGDNYVTIDEVDDYILVRSRNAVR